MRKSHQVRPPTLRRNRRAPCAHIRPLRLDGTQGTDPDRPEEVERARGADMARRWRVSKTPREPMSLPCAKPLLRREASAHCEARPSTAPHTHPRQNPSATRMQNPSNEAQTK